MRVIDLFAGCGGSSTGAVQAGANVIWAANHWQQAVDTHEANHPGAEHRCQDLHQTDWRSVPDHDLLWASPACQGHSPAGQPGRKSQEVKSKQQMDRNTAWAVVSAAEVKRPRTIVVENVRRFLHWELLEPWQRCLEILGYKVRHHVFDAAEFGTPQNRKRAIITAQLDEPFDILSPDLEPRGFGECIEWNRGEWATILSKPAGVRRRIHDGKRRGCGPRFLTHYVTGHRGRELDRPIGCITTKDQWAVVKGGRTRLLSLVELRRAMDFEDSYQLPRHRNKAIRMLGNGVPVLMAKAIVEQAMAQ